MGGVVSSQDKPVKTAALFIMLESQSMVGVLGEVGVASRGGRCPQACLQLCIRFLVVRISCLEVCIRCFKVAWGRAWWRAWWMAQWRYIGG